MDANNFAISRITESDQCVPESAKVMRFMPIPCNTHKPKSVTSTKRIISRFMLVLLVLNVYFRLAKKLKQKAQVVDITFAGITGRPKDFNKKRAPKSIAVLTTPIAVKRIFCELFFIATLMIFLYEIRWSVFCLIEDSANILPYHAE